jgi:hypothetical protein
VKDVIHGFEDVPVFYLNEQGQVRVVRVSRGKRDVKNLLENESDEAAQ